MLLSYMYTNYGTYITFDFVSYLPPVGFLLTWNIMQ